MLGQNMNIIQSQVISPHSFRKSFSSTIPCSSSLSRSKIASARRGYFFQSTLNFRLIWSLVLVIWVATIVKSLPYFFSRLTRSRIQGLVQLAGAFFLGVGVGVSLVIFFPFLSLSSRAISSMKVWSVETDDYPLEFSCEWASSAVKQKTYPALPEPQREGEGSYLRDKSQCVIGRGSHGLLLVGFGFNIKEFLIQGGGLSEMDGEYRISFIFQRADIGVDCGEARSGNILGS